MAAREADLDGMPEPGGDAWDKAMHQLSDLELELLRANAYPGLLRGEARAYQAGFKAAVEQSRREECRASKGVLVSPMTSPRPGTEG